MSNITRNKLKNLMPGLDFHANKEAALYKIYMMGHSRRTNSPLEGAIMAGFTAWANYADVYNRDNAWGYKLGNDFVLGTYWKDWGEALHNLLLYGDIGGIDEGDLSTFYHECLKAEGFEYDMEGLEEE
jgi:hypothetical protein